MLTMSNRTRQTDLGQEFAGRLHLSIGDLSRITGRSERALYRMVDNGAILAEQPTPRAAVLVCIHEARRVFPHSFAAIGL